MRNYTLLIPVLLLFLSCKETNSNSPSNQKISKNDAVVLTIDGKTRTISTQDLENDLPNFEESPIRYLFRKKLAKNEKPKFDINFAFSDSENLTDLPKLTTLPKTLI